MLKLSRRIQFSRLKYCNLKSVFNNSHDANETIIQPHLVVQDIYTNNKYFLIFLCFFFSYQEKEDTLLIHAARLGKEDVVDLLLLAGAHIEATNKVTKTVKLSQVMLTEYTCMHAFLFIILKRGCILMYVYEVHEEFVYFWF